MITVKSFKLWLYKELAKSPLLYLLSFIANTVSLIFMWIARSPLNLDSVIWWYIAVGILLVMWLLLFLTGIMIWAWYFVLFRYAVYFVSWVISLIRRLLKNRFTQIIIALVLVTQFLICWDSFMGEESGLREVLRFPSIIRILVFTALLFSILHIIKLRKRIFISEFKNYTGDEKLKSAVEGMGARLLNEMNRLSKLLKTIDEIQPESKMGMLEPAVDIQDIGKDFAQIIGPESSVEIGKFVKIPLKPLINFFKKLVHGPILTGSVHLKGDVLVLTACLSGHIKGSWNVCSGDIQDMDMEKPPASNTGTEALLIMTDLLVCRIFTNIARGASPRWQAIHHYTKGLRLYRETIRTEENKKMNLIKAKDAFTRAIRFDKEFVQCYYNFGIIYIQLESWDAAKAAFREALKVDPGNHYCYYQLAYIYFQEGKIKDAPWFCEQARAICPTGHQHWTLWAILRYRLWLHEYIDKYNYEDPFDISPGIIQHFNNAAVLSWRALCKSIITGEKTKKFKDTAGIHIRNLAMIKGMKRHWKSRCLFRQALFLAPDSNDLHFEAGRYFFRRGNINQAYKLFKRVFDDDEEVKDPFSFWAFYLNVYVHPKNKEKKNDEEKKNIYNHFLDAAAGIIDNIEQYTGDIDIFRKHKIRKIVLNIMLALDAVSPEKKIGKEDKDKLISRLNEELNSKRNGDSMIECLKQANEANPQPCPDFSKWLKNQKEILSVRKRLEQKEKTDVDLNKVLDQLNSEIEELKKEHPNEPKILGLHRYLAEAYLEKKNYNEAMEAARKAVRLNPYDGKVREILGKILVALKDFNWGVKELETAFNMGRSKPEILKEIGSAYIEKGEILRDPQKRKEAFESAEKFFIRAHDIIEDKSFQDKEENGCYSRCLGEIHFYLGKIYRELLKYDDAITNFNVAQEMGHEKLESLVEIGWTYVELGSLNEADRVFEEVKSESENPPIDIIAEIILGRMFVRIERIISISDYEETFFDDEKPMKIMKDVERMINAVEDSRKRNRLWPLYHQCKGRLYYKTSDKEGKAEEAAKAFEKSLSYKANPDVYYYLAQSYRDLAVKEKIASRKSAYLTNARTACSLCRNHDQREKYKTEMDELVKKIDTLEGKKTEGK